MGQFRDAYGPGVTKPDIFHYVYALLHHPEYRERYKENLKRELPRIPLVGTPPSRQAAPPPRSGEVEEAEEVGADDSSSDPLRFGEGEALAPERGSFRAFADIGRELAALHVGYEDAGECPLQQIVNKDVPFSWRVSKMRLSADRTAVVVNECLTLAGVPPQVFDYRLGNRSALEWVLDQYQVTTDKRSGLVSDPNREDQPDYIARLVGRVVTVSVETVRLVGRLPPLTLNPDATPPPAA